MLGAERAYGGFRADVGVPRFQILDHEEPLESQNSGSHGIVVDVLRVVGNDTSDLIV